jgi:hypothetical protein
VEHFCNGGQVQVVPTHAGQKHCIWPVQTLQLLLQPILQQSCAFLHPEVPLTAPALLRSWPLFHAWLPLL